MSDARGLCDADGDCDSRTVAVSTTDDDASRDGWGDAERLATLVKLPATLPLGRPLHDVDSVGDGDGEAADDALVDSVEVAIVLAVLVVERSADLVACALRADVIVTETVNEFEPVDDGDVGGDRDPVPLRVFPAADAHAVEVNDGETVAALLSLVSALATELADGTNVETGDAVASTDGVADDVNCDADEDALFSADRVAAPAAREGVATDVALPQRDTFEERDAALVAVARSVAETGSVDDCDALSVPDVRPVMLPLGLSAALRVCATLAADEGDATLFVGTPLEEAERIGDRDADALPLARTLRDALDEDCGEPDMDALADGESVVDAEPESIGDVVEAPDCDCEREAADERDGNAVPETVEQTVLTAVPADDTD